MEEERRSLDLSLDSGVPSHSQTNVREDTYVKAPFPRETSETPSPPLYTHQYPSEPSLRGMEYNAVQIDMNASPYDSIHNAQLRRDEPTYVKVQKPENQENVGIGDILRQLTNDIKEKNSDSSGSVIHIGNITINNSIPDPPYHYGSVPRRPPDPCRPNPYDYLYHPKSQISPSTPEENPYIGVGPPKTPVEHGQGSGTPDITPYRETRDFISRRSSDRTRDSRSGLREAENNTQTGAEGNTPKITIQSRQSPDGPLNTFDVHLTLPGSNQCWEGELKPSTVSASERVLTPVLGLPENTYDSHTKSHATNYPTIARVIDATTERVAESDNNDKESLYKNDDRGASRANEENILKLSEDGAAGTTSKVEVHSVDNPIYMTRPNDRFVVHSLSMENVNRQEKLSYTMDAVHEGRSFQKGWTMSQSTPDVRRSSWIRASLSTLNKPQNGSHQCDVEGFFSVHDERAIDEAKSILEHEGEDGNWLVSSAVRQPMQTYCLHVRIHDRTYSFPINKMKGGKIAIDTSSSKSFACLCKLIKCYSKKKKLPSQNMSLGNAFKMPPPCQTHL